MSCAFFVTTSLLSCPSPAHGKNCTGTDGSTQIRSRVLFHTELAEDGETVGRLSLGRHFSRFSFLNPVLELSRWRPQCRHLLIGGSLGSRAAPPGRVPAGYHGSHRSCPGVQHPAGGGHDFAVAQAVDEQVEQRHDVGVGQRQRAILPWGVAGLGLHVREGGAAIVEEGDGQVRGTGGGSLPHGERRWLRAAAMAPWKARRSSEGCSSNTRQVPSRRSSSA